MPFDTQAMDCSTADERTAFTGLEGVEEFAKSHALQILRELGHGPEFGALMRLAEIVEAQEAAIKAAAQYPQPIVSAVWRTGANQLVVLPVMRVAAEGVSPVDCMSERRHPRS